MMNIWGINSVNYGSTGKIMLSISSMINESDSMMITVSPYGNDMKKGLKNHIFLGDRVSRRLSSFCSKVTGFSGCFAIASTFKLLCQFRKVNLDLIHLHNLHNDYINLPLLFSFIKRYHIPVVWTLHDCWAFTGHCPHFALEECEKWKTGCHDCPLYREYPQSKIDNSKFMWKLKKKWFAGVENMTIVTPSQWLADLVKQSYLKDYPVIVINNGIDLSVFQPTESDFRKKNGIKPEQKMLLGVAFGWSFRKGLDVFMELSKRLDHEKYQIVLVGTDDAVDKQLPESIISIHRTQNQKELAEIYTAADLFVNPTREEVLGLVNLEALACGTPGITFDAGGSPECYDKTCGAIVNCDDVDSMEKEIIRICESQPFTSDNCIKYASNFDANKKFGEYVALYSTIERK